MKPKIVQGGEGFGRDPRMDAVHAHVVKFASDPLETATLQAVDDDRQFFESNGALEPPYDPKTLLLLYEHSNSLRQNVEAYSTNIDGFGHTFKAVIDLEADSTIDEVRTLIALERQAANNTRDEDLDIDEATDEEVKTRIKKLANAQRLESLRLGAFFENCSEMSFTDLRRRTREDMEITGNGYWEVLRNRTGAIALFNYVESHTMRLTNVDAELTEYQIRRRTMTQDFEVVTRKKRFRRFIQKVGLSAVFFKEFGDPRLISARTGKAYKDERAMLKAEEDARPATEIMHFAIPSSRSAYGIPRWIGNTLSVLGSRQSEDVNFSYFENKSVPPLAVLVSGGRLTKDSVSRLEDFIKNEIRGKQNFHKILIIEAEGAESTAFENSGRMKIELQPLTEAQNADALFQQYDERNIDKVGMSFRVPRMLRGDTRDFNRSTAMAALDFAERQVFEPERTSFDDRLNRHILPALGIKHWKIKSNGPTQRDPESLAKMIHDCQDFMTPNMLLELAQGVFNRNFPRIDAIWADQPLKLTLATINKVPGGQGVAGETPVAEDANPDNQAPATEPNTTSAASDNAAADQPRAAGGQFGNVPKPGPAGQPAKPKPKTRVQPARKADNDNDDRMIEVADLLVDAREVMREAVIEAGARRIDARRRVQELDDDA